jgi:hypothetical protein
VISSLLLFLGACGPAYTMIKTANPNPLAGQKSFAIDNVSYEGMKIGNPGTITEEEWAAKKKPEEQAKFREDLTNSKNRFNEQVIKHVTSMAGKAGVTVAAGGQAPFTLKPQVIELEPGYNAFVSTAPAVVRLQVKVVDAQGQEVEVVEVRGARDAGSFGAMVTRLGMVGEDLGDRVGRYLADRTAGK